MKKKLIWGIVILAVIVLIIIFGSNSVASHEAVKNFQGDIKIYKSGSCGCCGVYSNYFQRRGNSNAEVINLIDLDILKKDYGVPIDMKSCHTTLVGDYFVEGHVPLEAVEKLIKTKPDIKGIAMPGMPSGSPGMPGTKSGDFVIYAVNHDGSYGEFMRI